MEKEIYQKILDYTDQGAITIHDVREYCHRQIKILDSSLLDEPELLALYKLKTVFVKGWSSNILDRLEEIHGVMISVGFKLKSTSEEIGQFIYKNDSLCCAVYLHKMTVVLPSSFSKKIYSYKNCSYSKFNSILKKSKHALYR